MSRFACSFQSKALLGPTTVQVILPYPSFDPQTDASFEELYRGGMQFKTHTLFHGAFSDADMWLHLFNIEYYAEKYHLAVVMPSVGNSFYADLQHGPAYWTYVSEELPRYLRSVFPLSPRREDNFVAGISMGGYGALKMALNKPDQYAAGICLSGALDIVSIMKNPIHPIFNVDEYFGGFEKLAGSTNDLYALLPALVSQRVPLPRLYMACGVDDSLHEMSTRFRDLARENPVDLTYEEGPGAHTWEFWDVYLRRALDWLDGNLIQGKRVD
jgi:putative tributyrin esterase